MGRTLRYEPPLPITLQIVRASTGSVISLVNVLIHMSRMQAELLQAEHASQAIASW
jgi:hypothetical protein